MEGLKRCDLFSDWCEQISNRGTWQGLVAVAAMELNEEIKVAEQIKRDICKQRREGDSHTLQNGWSCHEPGRSFVGRNKASLVNHTRQNHSMC